MISIIRDLISWPDGIIVGNLIASALWAAPTFLHMHRKLNRQHAEHLHHIRKIHEHLESVSATRK